MSELLILKLAGATVLSICLFISIFRKNHILPICIILFGIGFFAVINSFG